jgi:hypothetical protein
MPDADVDFTKRSILKSPDGVPAKININRFESSDETMLSELKRVLVTLLRK